MYKAVLFDLDGTLLDTGDGVISSVRYTIEKMKLPMLSDDELKTFVGPPIKKKMMEVFSLSDETSSEAMNIFRNHYGIEDIYIARVYDGLVELLEELKNEGYKLGVATYKREDQAKNLLQKFGLAEKFDVIHGSDKEGKLTKADVVNNCILDLNVNPKEAVLVGDSDNDAIGAKQAGLKFVGVTYGFGFKSETDVECFDNIGIANSCQEIVKYV